MFENLHLGEDGYDFTFLEPRPGLILLITIFLGPVNEQVREAIAVFRKTTIPQVARCIPNDVEIHSCIGFVKL